ncbi:MAG: hypothetical protein OSJ72_18135 [Lachnospiraceae bacterium]|nr:hypothetical protein [Lachnospiraceae bacterium]
MSRLEIPIPNKAQLVVEELYRDLERRIESSEYYPLWEPPVSRFRATRKFLP